MLGLHTTSGRRNTQSALNKDCSASRTFLHTDSRPAVCREIRNSNFKTFENALDLLTVMVLAGWMLKLKVVIVLAGWILRVVTVFAGWTLRVVTVLAG